MCLGGKYRESEATAEDEQHSCCAVCWMKSTGECFRGFYENFTGSSYRSYRLWPHSQRATSHASVAYSNSQSGNMKLN